MPRSQDRTKKQEIKQVVASLNRPNFEAMTCKQFVNQIGGRNKAKPEHKTSQCTCPRRFGTHRIEYERYEYGLDERGDNGKDVDHRVGIPWLSRLPNTCPPGREEQFGVIPNKTTDHTDNDANNHSQPIDVIEIRHTSLLLR